MATWIAHFRIADYFRHKIDNLSETEFIVGNIGPDCGEPNSDWSEFTPPTEVTHWRNKEFEINSEEFYRLYLEKNSNSHSFYLGYYIHLLADIEWNKQIYGPKKELYKTEFEKDAKFIWTMKKDWYHLDHLYLNEHPEFHVFRTFSQINEFPNNYLDYYSNMALIHQVKHISNFYKSFNGNLDREYLYLTKQEMDEYVSKTCEIIHRNLLKKGIA